MELVQLVAFWLIDYQQKVIIKILLLEAGGKDTNPWIHIPIGYLKTMHNPKVDWCFKIQSDPGLDGREMNYPRGKVLGGSSSINGLFIY